MIRLSAGSATDVGLVRANNQDHLLVASPIFAVADGMGGHAAGEVASETAVEALRAAFEAAGASPQDVAEAVRRANRAVWDEAQANPDFRGMGTTLTVLAGAGDRLVVANVGDSRTYRLRSGTLEQLTVDHSLVAELVAEGQIGVEEAEHHPQRHVLTRALGVYPDVDVDVLTTETVAGDRYLLCSDGLSREVTDEAIAAVLRRLSDPTDAARELVAAAKLNGGADNITVVVVDVVDDDATGAAATAIEEAGKEPAVVAPGPVEAPARSGWRQRRRDRRAARPLRRRVVTVRVVGFLVLLLAVLALGAAGTAWYARAAYFVGLQGDRVVIYQGRPGGVLWWKPTVAEVTATTTADVEPYHLGALRAGVQEPTLAAARHYVANLRSEAAGAGLTAVTAPGGDPIGP